MFDGLYLFFYELVYHIDYFLCKVLAILYSFFDVFAGIKQVDYDGTPMYLINVFFEKTPAMRIYSSMAIIGIAISFAFTIYAVIKKMFDIDDKVKNSLGGILGNQLKCILFILLMNFVIMLVLRSTNTLMERVIDIFNNSSDKARYTSIEFTSDQYATMGRIMNTIGNYSLNPSYDSRYNVNACYNEIRPDLLILEGQDVFKYTYEFEDEDGKLVKSWQYYLTKIANAHNLATEMYIDEYDEALMKAMTNCMEQIWVNDEFGPLEGYKSGVEPISSEDTPFDVLIFLSGTSRAAKNAKYNENPDIFDTLRYDYIKEGGKSIYDLGQVEEDFDISFAKFDHLAIIILGVVLAKVFLSLCINCVARIFNLMLLYLIAPVFIATTPLDDGEKTKQWSTAFIVQAFAVFGSVFGIRILMLFVSMVFNAKLVLFESETMNFFGKIIMVYAAACTLEQASKIVTGILANNAGFQSIQASDVGSTGAARAIGTAKMLGGKALGAAGTILNHSPLGTIKNAVTSAWNTSPFGFLTGTGVGSKAGLERRYEKANDEAKKKAQAEKDAKEGKLSPEEKMSQSAEKMSAAADKLSESLRNYAGAKEAGGGEGGSKDKDGDKGDDPKNNSNLGGDKGGDGETTTSRPRAGTFSTDRESRSTGGAKNNQGDKNGQGDKNKGTAGGKKSNPPGRNRSNSVNVPKNSHSLPSVAPEGNKGGSKGESKGDSKGDNKGDSKGDANTKKEDGGNSEIGKNHGGDAGLGKDNAGTGPQGGAPADDKKESSNLGVSNQGAIVGGPDAGGSDVGGGAETRSRRANTLGGTKASQGNGGSNTESRRRNNTIAGSKGPQQNPRRERAHSVSVPTSSNMSNSLKQEGGESKPATRSRAKTLPLPNRIQAQNHNRSNNNSNK